VPLVAVLLLSFFLSLNASFAASSVTVSVKQGDVASFQVEVDSDLPVIIGKFRDHKVPFFRLSSSRKYEALIGADLAEPPGVYRVTLIDPDGAALQSPRPYRIKVLSQKFGTQELNLPQESVDLDPATLARVEKEKTEMAALFGKVTEERLWESGFLVPVEGKIAGAFGRKRILNGQPRSSHNGEDIAAPMGAVVRASNTGKVVMTDELFFSGKSIVLDHGWGVFTMYFHLSEMGVQQGEVVKKGQIIGRVGASGRATGPHLHWGLRLAGARVNPFALTRVSTP
jgi:murein DD-endopeptidase MepM/ murein hydrolase activator NlpD